MPWPTKYTPAQRTAIERHGVDLRWKVRRIVDAAAAGMLQETAESPALDPFEIPRATVQSFIRKAEKRKAGELRPELASLKPADRAASLQVRLVALVDHDISRLEKLAAKQPNAPMDHEHLRKLARAIREIQTFGDPTSKRLARTPGATENGRQPEGPTRDNLSGALLAAANRHAPQPATSTPLPTGDNGSGEQRINATAPTTNNGTTAPHDDEHDGLGDGDDGASLAAIEVPTGLVAAAVVVGPGAT